MGEPGRGPLTEAMFYTLMALLKGYVCGTDVAGQVERRTGGLVKLGPGTLYTILARFLEEKLIVEVESTEGGRRRVYSITEKGRAVYRAELERLRRCLRDGEEAQQ